MTSDPSASDPTVNPTVTMAIADFDSGWRAILCYAVQREKGSSLLATTLQENAFLDQIATQHDSEVLIAGIRTPDCVRRAWRVALSSASGHFARTPPLHCPKLAMNDPPAARLRPFLTSETCRPSPSNSSRARTRRVRALDGHAGPLGRSP